MLSSAGRMAVDMRWILAIRLCASKFKPARKPSKSSWRRITKRMQKNDDGLQLSTFRAACSVRRQAKHRDVLLGQSADGLGQWLRFSRSCKAYKLDVLTRVSA